jgi:hypothetical protein
MTRLKISLIFSLCVLILSCSSPNKDSKERETSYPLIQCLNDLDSANHNDTVNIQGYLQKYESAHIGKGGGTQYFNYEIVFADSTKVSIEKEAQIDAGYSENYINLRAITNKSSIHDDPTIAQNTADF